MRAKPILSCPPPSRLPKAKNCARKSPSSRPCWTHPLRPWLPRKRSGNRTSKRRRQNGRCFNPATTSRRVAPPSSFCRDGSILAGGKNPAADSYEISASTNLTGITGVRLEVMSDPSLPAGGPGRDPDGNFFLSDFEVQAAPAEKSASRAEDCFQRGGGGRIAITDTVLTTWSTTSRGPRDGALIPPTDKSATIRRGVLIPDKPFGFAGGTVLTIRMKHDMAFSQVWNRPLPDFRHHHGRSAHCGQRSRATAQRAGPSPGAAHGKASHRSRRRLSGHCPAAAAGARQEKGGS